MLAHLFMVVTAAAFGTSAASQSVADASGFDDVIVGAWSGSAKCNRESAQRVSFDAVLAEKDKLTGACVQSKVSGRAAPFLGKDLTATQKDQT
jgi:hypothetical protein